MKVLITAGSTQVPIDQVRSISNIFKGRTGWSIADHFSIDQGDEITLITSNVFGDLPTAVPGFGGVTIKQYRTFDELAQLLEQEVRTGNYDAIVHSAAISDYKVSRVLDSELQPLDSSKKVSSSHSKMYLELTPTIKLVDQFRKPWGFKGILVKFKLQVGITTQELVEIAEKSRITSSADIIVANCLEWSQESALIIRASRLNGGTATLTVSRKDLPLRLHQAIVEESLKPSCLPGEG